MLAFCAEWDERYVARTISSTDLRITSATPEPGTLMLLGTGMFGLLAYAWRKRR